MIRLGCYEFIVCKGNVFKRIRKTKTHACLCCRAAVSFCNVALHLHLVIRLCANWAAVRQPVQALHGVIPASEPESWAASCVVLHCAIAGDAARNVSTMPLRANWAAVRHSVQAPPPVIPASERESWAALCGVLGYPNRHTGVHPRYRLAGCRLGGRHDGAEGTREERKGGKGRCAFLHCAPHLHLVIRLRANWAAVRHSVQAPPPVIPASEPESWAALCGVLRCTAASLLSIPANASQDPVSEHGVTGREENAGTKGCYTKNRRKRFRRDKSLWLAAV